MPPVVPSPESIRAFENEQAFARWLAVNHAKKSEIFLRIFKKDSGVATITYAQALDVALCWGWIDGLRKRFDERSFLQRFTPRTSKSIWSQVNREHVARLTQAGRMTPHGLAQVQAAQADGRWDAAYAGSSKLSVPADLLAAIEADRDARAFFRELPELRLVLNHGGRPAVMTGVLEPWRTEIIAFAKETSAVVKCSGLVERAGVEWTKASVKPYVASLLEAFGTRRTMFATNWPVSTISSTYDLWVNTLVEILDDLGLSRDEKDDVMWRTASRHYRWPRSQRTGRSPPGWRRRRTDTQPPHSAPALQRRRPICSPSWPCAWGWCCAATSPRRPRSPRRG